MIFDVMQNYTSPLTKARLFDWHAALFPTGRTVTTKIRGTTKIRVRASRDDASGPMQVVSGPVLRAAFANLWFVTIHSFDDGNERIARVMLAGHCVSRHR